MSDAVTTEGFVRSVGRGGLCRVDLDSAPPILAKICGRMQFQGPQRRKILIVPGDRVSVRLSPHDRDRGLIIYRQDKERAGGRR